MASVLLSVELGAAGRPTLTYMIERALGKGPHRATNPPTTTHPKISTLPQILETSILPPSSSEREMLKLTMLRTMRPLPLQYSWTFHHSSSATATTITTLMSEINSIKSFWEVHNQFPLHKLPPNHSVHFFKQGVRPTWADERNIAGGAWTFKVPKGKSKDLWMEILLLAIGEQFADFIHPGDDLCGLSFTMQSSHDVITIWNRDGSNRASIQGILSVVLEKVNLTLEIREGSYKKHSDQPGFGQAVAAAAAAAGLARWAKFSCC